MTLLSTSLDITVHPAVAAPIHHSLPTPMQNTPNVSPVGLPNVVGGIAIMILLVGMLKNALSAASPSNAGQKVMTEWEDVHRANLLRNLEHRMQVARTQGDQNLIRLLEEEREQFVPPHTLRQARHQG